MRSWTACQPGPPMFLRHDFLPIVSSPVHQSKADYEPGHKRSHQRFLEHKAPCEDCSFGPRLVDFERSHRGRISPKDHSRNRLALNRGAPTLSTAPEETLITCCPFRFVLGHSASPLTDSSLALTTGSLTRCSLRKHVWSSFLWST